MCIHVYTEIALLTAVGAQSTYYACMHVCMCIYTKVRLKSGLCPTTEYACMCVYILECYIYYILSQMQLMSVDLVRVCIHLHRYIHMIHTHSSLWEPLFAGHLFHASYIHVRCTVYSPKNAFLVCLLKGLVLEGLFCRLSSSCMHKCHILVFSE